MTSTDMRVRPVADFLSDCDTYFLPRGFSLHIVGVRRPWPAILWPDFSGECCIGAACFNRDTDSGRYKDRRRAQNCPLRQHCGKPRRGNWPKLLDCPRGAYRKCPRETERCTDDWRQCHRGGKCHSIGRHKHRRLRDDCTRSVCQFRCAGQFDCHR